MRQVVSIQISINYLAPFSEITNKPHENIEIKEGTTFSELLDRLFYAYRNELRRSKIDRLDSNLLMILNGNVLHKKTDMDRNLSENDSITIGIVVAGG